MSIKMRQRIERMIARRVVLDCIAAGYALNVNNGGDTHELPAPSRSVKEVLGAMFATDEEYLTVYKLVKNRRDPRPDMDSWKNIGWVWFVYGDGDGSTVVSDYTVNLEPVMKGASELADKYA